MAGDTPKAVLITGVFGTGKSAVAEEIAYLLEQHEQPYALLDLDFLSWFDTARPDGPSGHEILLDNLDAVVANYLAVGIKRFILAHCRTRRGRAGRHPGTSSKCLLRTVRLTAPLETIATRLNVNPTARTARRPTAGR